MRTPVNIGTRKKMVKLERHIERQPEDARAVRGALKLARQKSRRMDVMDKQLRQLATRYVLYRTLFERAMEVIEAQAALIEQTS